MSFENGTFTSSFVDSQKITTITSNQSYILDSMSSNSWKITLTDGDVYSFDSSTGTGTLTDYENGVMDTSRNWNFTFTRNTWMDYDDFSDNLLDTSKWTATSSYFVGNQPTEANGRIELSGLTSQYSNTFLLFKNSEGIDGVEADIWLPSGAPVDTGVLIGIADAGTPVGYLDLWVDSAQTNFSIGLDNSSTGESINLTRNAELGKMYKVAIIKGKQKTALYLDGEKVAEVSTWQSEDLDIIFRGVNDAGSSFTTYMDNVRVLRNWEDYDDFTATSINPGNWDLGYWDGGNAPTIGNGKITLSGNNVSGFNSVLPSTGMLTFNAGIKAELEKSFASTNGTESHSFLELANNDISAIAVEVTLPFDAHSSTAIGLYASDWTKAFSDNLSDKSFFGLDLWSDHIDVEYVDPNTGSLVSSSISTQAGSSHVFSFIFDTSMVSMHVDGEKVAEFSSSNFSRDSILIRAMNEAGESFTAYAQNVRVIRNWEDYDDFTATSINPGNWDLGYWDGGNAPTIGNGKITLSGNNVSGFNSVLPSTGMLTFNAGIKAELEKSFASTNGTESHSFLELANNDISAIAVEVTLPFDAHSSTAIGLYASDWTKAFSDNLSDKSFFGLDLWSDHIDVEYVDPNTGSLVSSSISTQAGSSHVFSFIFDTSMVSMHVDGEKVAEFSSSNFSRDSILIRAMNEAGESFTAYAQNVRVIRNWEDYDDFSSGSLNTTKWELAWWKGGRSPSVVNRALELGGSGDPNDPASDSLPYALSLLTLQENGSTHPFAIITDSSVYGLEAEIMLPVGTQYSTGLNFLCFDTTSQEADGSFKEFGPEIEYWSGQKPALEYQYLDPSTGETVEVSIPANFGDYYKMSLIQDGSKSLILIDGDKVAEFDYPDFSPNAFGFFAFNDEGHAFETYVKNVRVLRRSTTATQPDPVTVVSDPNGQAVVVQVGNEYQWKSTLDGVTLWGVEQSSDGWSAMTMRFENGRNFGNQGFFDSVAQPQPYDAPYEIDENGYIKSLEDDGDYQYYNPVSVENGVIGTIQNDEGVDSVANNGINQVDQWFFTTRAAAEEFYYFKVNPGSGYQTPSGGYQTPGGGSQSTGGDESPSSEMQPAFPMAKVYEPIVRTVNYQLNGEQIYTLGGQILTDGGSAILESGIIISENLSFSGPKRRIIANPPLANSEFYISVNDLKPATTYYYRAFARNAVGETQGVRKRLKTPENLEPGSWLYGMQSLGNGWSDSDWFGQLRRFEGTGWIFHSDLGWLYSVNNQSGGVWLWDQNNRWCWTQRGVWPYIYQNQVGGWLYFLRNQNGQNIFYDYQERSYISVP
jgi:hypothetical protein